MKNRIVNLDVNGEIHLIDVINVHGVCNMHVIEKYESYNDFTYLIIYNRYSYSGSQFLRADEFDKLIEGKKNILVGTFGSDDYRTLNFDHELLQSVLH